MKTIFTLAITLLSSLYALSQDVIPETIKKKKVHGTFYATWGYHHDHFTNSSIRFKDEKEANPANNFDFVLHHAKATDHMDIYKDFFGGEPLTVPQYVFYTGYFFENKGDWGIELGWDHLKYIVNDNQTMHLTGDIHGKHYDLDTLVTPSFVHYEHTNGNNYLMASIVKRYTFFRSPAGSHKLSALTKLGGGALVPKTFSKMFGNQNDGPFRPAGFVIGGSVALRYDFMRRFFVEHAVKGCFDDYTGAKLWGAARATQTFLSVQYVLSWGIYISPTKKKKA